MKQFMSYVVWVIMAAVFGGMITLVYYFPILIAPFICLVILMAVIITRNRNKVKKKAEENIPEEVLQDFEEAERRYIESGGKKSANAILWEIARTKQRGIGVSQVEEPRVRVPVISSPSFRGQTVQNNFAPNPGHSSPEVRRSQTGNRKGFLGKRRR